MKDPCTVIIGSMTIRTGFCPCRIDREQIRARKNLLFVSLTAFTKTLFCRKVPAASKTMEPPMGDEEDSGAATAAATAVVKEKKDQPQLTLSEMLKAVSTSHLQRSSQVLKFPEN